MAITFKLIRDFVDKAKTIEAIRAAHIEHLYDENGNPVEGIFKESMVRAEEDELYSGDPENRDADTLGGIAAENYVTRSTTLYLSPTEKLVGKDANGNLIYESTFSDVLTQALIAGPTRWVYKKELKTNIRNIIQAFGDYAFYSPGSATKNRRQIGSVNMRADGALQLTGFVQCDSNILAVVGENVDSSVFEFNVTIRYTKM